MPSKEVRYNSIATQGLFGQGNTVMTMIYAHDFDRGAGAACKPRGWAMKRKRGFCADQEPVFRILCGSI